MIKNTFEERSHQIAYDFGKDLPEDFQHAVYAENMRVSHDVLAKRGLNERKVLIIGGAGYIGSVLTEHFLSHGYHVRSFDYLMFNNGLTVLPYLSHPNYEFVRGDLSKHEELEPAFDGVTDVVMLAGLVGDPITKKIPEAADAINDRGHELMLEIIKEKALNKVVFVSTCSNYGLIKGDELADENFELNPLSLYAKSKVRVEKNLLSMKGEGNFTGTVLRFATAFGLSSRMRFDLTVSEFTRAMFLNEDLLVYDAETWRPYCHLQDFADLIRRVLEAPQDAVSFEVFNAGGEINNFTKQMIVDAVLNVLPNASVRYQKHGADPRNYRVDFTKVRERLHFTPAYTVHDGVVELVNAMKQGLFLDIHTPPSFYGNYDVKYEI